jgi:hypothetical protein
MPRWFTRLFWILLSLGLAAFAYGPLRGAGPVGDDFQVLSDASAIAWPSEDGAEEFELGDLFQVHGQDERPLAALSLLLTSRIWTDEGEWTPAAVFGLRLENLALLLLAAIGISRFMRRMLEPWAGREHARAVSHASRVLVALHPLTAAAVASASARGDLLGAALVGFAANCFLRGRQERSKKLVVFAGLLTVAAGCASEIAFFVGPIVALGEFTSSRRHLRMKRRLRTASSSGISFLLCALVEPVFAAFGPGVRLPDMARALGFFDGTGDFTYGLGLLFERLGVLIVPVNASAFGPAGFALAGVLGLVVLQPVLIAARSAPRMWSWVLFWWIVIIVLAQLSAADVRVHPDDLTQAPLLLPAAIVAAIGVALSATSNSGRRRFLLPAIAGCVFALLARGDARAIANASVAAADVRVELREARDAYGEAATLLWVDHPRLLEAHAVLPLNLGALIGEESGAARSLSTSAFLALVSDPSWTDLSEGGVVVFRLGDDPAWIPPGEPTAGARLWREEGRSPALDLAATEIASVRVLAQPGTSTESSPRISWLSLAGGDVARELDGAWIVDEEGLHAVFDVGNVPDWVTAGRVQKIWFGQGLAVVVQAAAYEKAHELSGLSTVRVEGEDWVVGLESAMTRTAEGGEGSFWLCLFDPLGLRYDELECSRDGDSVTAIGAVRKSARMSNAGGAPTWVLEQRMNGVTVARSRAR